MANVTTEMQVEWRTQDNAATPLIETLERMVEKTPQQDEHLDGLLEYMMADYPDNPALLTTKQKRQRKIWAAMEQQAGHTLGTCFDTNGELCPVCRST